MERNLIGTLRELIGKRVKICGWAQTIRNQRRMQFLVIRDHTGMVQVTHERLGQGDAIEESLLKLTLESVVEIYGTVVEAPQVKLGGIEIFITEIKIVNLASVPLPIDEKTGSEQRADWRFLDLRRQKSLTIFKVQTLAEQAMREFWKREGFLEIHSPKLLAAASESGAELFKVEYFGKTAYLAQSPQFYKQMAMAAGFDRVFEIGPVFRANPSFTSRHDTEFTSVDFEISWINSHEEVMAFEEAWLRFIFQEIKIEYGTAIKEMFGQNVVVPVLPFPRVTLAKACEIVAGKGYIIPREQGDLDPEGERILYSYIKENYGHEWVFVTDYPVSVRPFYHMRHEDAPDKTKSFDLLWKGVEVTTGAQREHRYDVLLRQAKEKGLSPEPIQFYLDFFRFGCPPHGGLGFGLTRMLMLLLGMPNVREVTYLYRGPNRLSP